MGWLLVRKGRFRNALFSRCPDYLSGHFLFSAKSPYFQSYRLQSVERVPSGWASIIEIEIATIEIEKLPENDFDHDFDFDTDSEHP